MRFPLSEDAQAALSRWSPTARTLFEELVEDAASDLQREFLARAMAAGHTAAQVHAFADQLRGQRDTEVFDACTLASGKATHFTLEHRLAAEADPLAAFQFNGGAIDPKDAGNPTPVPVVPAPPRSPLDLPMGARPSTFDSGLRPVPSGKGDARVPMAVSASGAHSVSLVPGVDAFAEALLGEATRSLGLAWREKDLDTRGGVALADALAVAATALARGIPVPCLMGPGVGQHRRFVLLLQLTVAGKSHAWQLYDPMSRELVWANESDLLLARELPFANKVNRRLTRIILPYALRSTG